MRKKKRIYLISQKKLIKQIRRLYSQIIELRLELFQQLLFDKLLYLEKYSGTYFKKI